MKISRRELSGKLIDIGYANLFMRADHNSVDSIWAIKGNREKIMEVCMDDSEPALGRFLAAEIIFLKNSRFAPKNMTIGKKLAKVYTEVLNEGTFNGNIWGLPGEIGVAGTHMLKTNKQECIYLLRLLLSNYLPVVYEGSREATFGNGYQYRIRDIAAHYLSEMLHMPYEVALTPKDRDEAIKKIKQQISK